MQEEFIVGDLVFVTDKGRAVFRIRAVNPYKWISEPHVRIQDIKTESHSYSVSSHRLSRPEPEDLL